MTALAQALKAATVVDLEFSEEKIPGHSGGREKKLGFRPIKVAGVAVSNPDLVVYVRAEDPKGMYWYVLDWSVTDAAGDPTLTFASSEEQAKERVLLGLRAALADA
jgi:hypothetical protein